MGVVCTNIAHQNIKDRRALTLVPCGVGGTLTEYVPFYFAPRSPMLFTIGKGNVQGYGSGEDPIVHLVTSAEAVVESGLHFAFTDGHATVRFTEFFDDLGDLSKVDWDIMKARYWSDTSDDNDRLRRRQAEFLVHEFCPWKIIKLIGVKTEEVRRQVTEIISTHGYQPAIRLRRDWYYG
jgi:ssDNA thymidine ADP-ribosyltransferase, DarT